MQIKLILELQFYMSQSAKKNKVTHQEFHRINYTHTQLLFNWLTFHRYSRLG